MAEQSPGEIEVAKDVSVDLTETRCRFAEEFQI